MLTPGFVLYTSLNRPTADCENESSTGNGVVTFDNPGVLPGASTPAGSSARRMRVTVATQSFRGIRHAAHDRAMLDLKYARKTLDPLFPSENHACIGEILLFPNGTQGAV